MGNDIAIKGYREGVLPFPDGTIIARIWAIAPASECKVVEGDVSPSGGCKLYDLAD